MMKRAVIVGLGLIIGHLGYGQNNFGAWTSVNAKVPVTKKMEIGFGIQSRFESNLSKVDKSFLNPSLEYKWSDKIKTGLDYRFMNIAEDRFFGNVYTHRIALDGMFELWAKEFASKQSTDKNQAKLECSSRVRYTHEFTGQDLSDDYLRALVKIQYTIPIKQEVKCGIQSELFYHFNDQLIYSKGEVNSVNRFDKYRIRFDAEYGLTKRSEIDVFYIIQPEFESEDRKFVLGLKYTYKLRRLNKPKK